MNKLLISPSPHVHSGDSIEKNMYGVLIALIPAFICSVLFFGMGAIIVTLTSVVAVTDLLSAESFIGYKNMLIGNMGGSLGEVAALALLIGFAYMLFRKIITWHIPVSIFVTVIVFSGILNLCNPSLYAGPVFHLLSGGLMLGAIFMATDYVTSPMSNKGMIIYGIGIGLLTVVIRVFGAYPEGMSFAILIMNAFTPLINRYCKPVRFA